MVWILDHNGRRWVPDPPPKPRRKAKNLRFANLKPGDVLVHNSHATSVTMEDPGRLQVKGRDLPFSNDDTAYLVTKTFWVGFAVCEDRWFDPVAGQDDRMKGEMAALRYLTARGYSPHKVAHTLRGVASNGYQYATPEQAEVIMRTVNARVDIEEEFMAGRITAEEARLRVPSWAAMIREIGLEPGPPVTTRSMEAR